MNDSKHGEKQYTFGIDMDRQGEQAKAGPESSH